MDEKTRRMVRIYSRGRSQPDTLSEGGGGLTGNWRLRIAQAKKTAAFGIATMLALQVRV